MFFEVSIDVGDDEGSVVWIDEPIEEDVEIF